MLVCVSLQDNVFQRSALHWASERGLAGTVAQLLSHGADAALKDKVRACTCMRTWSYTYSMRVYSLGAYIFHYVTKTDTYIHKRMHIYVHQCLRYMYVIREIQVCLCVCMYMHACMHLYIYLYTHTYMCICMYVHGPDAGVPEQARFSAMHACMHVCMYMYTYVDVNISLPKSSTNVRNK